MRLALGLVTTLLWLNGCGKGDDPRRGGGDGGIPCASDAECDDGIPCTVDTCGVSEVCNFNPIDELCSAGTVCMVGMGCVVESECSMDAECDDAIECTLDTCGVGGVCNHMGLDELCASGQTCDAAMGCVGAMGCTADGDCDDSIDCTVDTCSVDMTCSNMPIDARCSGTDERCVPRLGCFVPMPCDTAADCDDGNFCNGAEVCMPEFGCAPAVSPRMCDDSDGCTIDSCDTTSDMCVFACDTSRTECDCPTPSATCEGAFSVTPTVSYTCGLGMARIDFGTATFTRVGPALNVRPRSASFADPLSDASPPVCPDFDATHTVAGGCQENYRIHGTFTDDNNFMGTVELTFVETDGISCTLGACANQTFMVTGTRM
jgi:hypothetical protein